MDTTRLERRVATLQLTLNKQFNIYFSSSADMGNNPQSSTLGHHLKRRSTGYKQP